MLCACHADKAADTAPDTGPYADEDGDGYAVAEGDCDDTRPDISMEATEQAANGLDEDCDGLDRSVDSLEGVVLAGGWAGADAGGSLAATDLDADGYADLLVGAPNLTSDNGYSGRAYAAYGPVAGSMSLADTIAFTSLPSDGDNGADWQVAGTDLDGDGLGDLIYAVPFGRGEEVGSGLVYVIPGPASEGNNFLEPELSIYGAVRNGTLGEGLCAPGDVDGDGLADLWVGSGRQGNSGGVTEPGRALLFAGPLGPQETEDAAILTLIGETDLDRTGTDIAAADWNQDGYLDVLVGSYWSSPNGQTSGQAWVVYGPRSGTLSLADADARLLGAAEGDYAGHAVATAGDVDADGTDDLLIGAPLKGEEGERSGRAWLLHGPVSGTVELSEQPSMFTSLGTWDWTGYFLGPAGDTNADGYADVIIAAPQQIDVWSPRRARLSLYLGPLDGPQAPEDADRIWVSPIYGDGAGTSFLAGPDLTGDGAPDLTVGAPKDSSLAYNQGSVVVAPQ